MASIGEVYGGGGDFGSPYGSDDLMAYNAFPTGTSSSSAGMGWGSEPVQTMSAPSPSGGGGGGLAAPSAPSATSTSMQQLQQQQMQQQQQQMLAQQMGSMGGLLPLTPPAAQPIASGGQKRSATYEDDPGYLETLWERRRDVTKLAILSLVVLLAISAHSAAWHYIREFIETHSRMTYWQEVGLRVAYPVVVLLVLWHLKAWGPGAAR